MSVPYGSHVPYQTMEQQIQILRQKILDLQVYQNQAQKSISNKRKKIAVFGKDIDSCLAILMIYDSLIRNQLDSPYEIYIYETQNETQKELEYYQTSFITLNSMIREKLRSLGIQVDSLNGIWFRNPERYMNILPVTGKPRNPDSEEWMLSVNLKQLYSSLLQQIVDIQMKNQSMDPRIFSKVLMTMDLKDSELKSLVENTELMITANVECWRFLQGRVQTTPQGTTKAQTNTATTTATTTKTDSDADSDSEPDSEPDSDSETKDTKDVKDAKDTIPKKQVSDLKRAEKNFIVYTQTRIQFNYQNPMDETYKRLSSNLNQLDFKKPIIPKRGFIVWVSMNELILLELTDVKITYDTIKSLMKKGQSSWSIPYDIKNKEVNDSLLARMIPFGFMSNDLILESTQIYYQYMNFQQPVLVGVMMESETVKDKEKDTSKETHPPMMKIVKLGWNSIPLHIYFPYRLNYTFLFTQEWIQSEMKKDPTPLSLLSQKMDTIRQQLMKTIVYDQNYLHPTVPSSN